MGEDNLLTLHKWKNPEELVRRFPIITYPRLNAGSGEDPYLRQIIASARVTMVSAPLMEISGTFIRNAIKEGRDISWFLPAAVWKYIREMHYYEK